MVEANFKNTASCEIILKGLKENLRKKRITYVIIDDFSRINESDETSYLFLISTSKPHIAKTLRECQTKKVHPIVISLQPLDNISGIYSSVTPNIEHSMYSIMSFLKTQGKNSPALYGISVNSAPDISRKNCFLQKHILQTGDESIYFNLIGLDDCFNRFFMNINKYDSVICTNNYAAIHLIKNLKKHCFPIEKLSVIGYGKILTATKFYPEIVFVYVAYERFGKAAVTILEELQSNEEVLHINMSVRHIISNTLNDLPEPFEENVVVFEEDASDIFYEDVNIKNMLLVEKLLSICDATDMHILDLVLQGKAYDLIAAETFLSQSAVKYRVKNMLQICGCKSKSQFVSFIKEYL